MSEWKRNQVIQICVSPFVRDIIEYKNNLSKNPHITDRKKGKSKICSEILSKYFENENNIPQGFREWREAKRQGL